jgi:hypothetical protein
MGAAAVAGARTEAGEGEPSAFLKKLMKALACFSFFSRLASSSLRFSSSSLRFSSSRFLRKN